MSQIQRFKDQDGNVYYANYPYKSRTAALLFDPFAIKKAQSGFGSQLTDQSGSFLWQTGKINYRAKTEGNQIFDSVGNFIVRYKDDAQRLNLFKNALQTRITDAKKAVTEYNVQQLSQFFPWLMSCQLLFQPIRSYIYLMASGINVANGKFQQFDLQSNIPSAMINSEVNKAIYQTVLTNGTLIQNAKQIYSKNEVSYLVKGYRVLADKSKQLKTYVAAFSSKLSSGLKSFYAKSYLTAPIRYLGRKFGTKRKMRDEIGEAALQQNPDVAGTKQFLDDLIKQIFKQLRIYGSLVVNVNYLRVAAIRKLVSGKTFYYFLDRPNLLFNVENSFVTAYSLDDNNQINLIPPGDFNISYLRNLVQNEVVNLGGRMFGSIKNDITKTDDQKKGMRDFSKKYLSWKQRVPTISSNQLKKFNQKTAIKKEKMSKQASKKFMDLYKTSEDERYLPKQPTVDKKGLGVMEKYYSDLEKRAAQIQKKLSSSVTEQERRQVMQQSYFERLKNLQQLEKRAKQTYQEARKKRKMEEQSSGNEYFSQKEFLTDNQMYEQQKRQAQEIRERARQNMIQEQDWFRQTEDVMQKMDQNPFGPFTL